MNFFEAHKSGKKFKRKNEDGFYHIDGYMVGATDNYAGEIHITEEDLLADDYEIEEQKIELSWEEVAKSLVKHYKITWNIVENKDVFLSLNYDNIKKDLGFKEDDV